MRRFPETRNAPSGEDGAKAKGSKEGIAVTDYPKEIFKAYDVRGIVGKTLTPAIVEGIGQAIGSEARARGQKAVAIGRDGRLSGPELSRPWPRGSRRAAWT
ncbi:MAG: hypothetical protein KatS3mg123_0858 [Burkholderiales bacterium]|nr:MAG: hypothetical protein KatS3mg123_0858 [Burkholderiales bacterium]